MRENERGGERGERESESEGESKKYEGQSVNKLIRWKILNTRRILISIQQSSFQAVKMPARTKIPSRRSKSQKMLILIRLKSVRVA